MDLVAIPVAVAVLIGDRAVMDFGNDAFSAIAMDGAMTARVTAFLRRDDDRESFAWRTGAAVVERHFRVTLARLPGRPGPACVISLFDETAEVRTRHDLRREMMTDSLTGLPNRAGFSERLETLLADAGVRFAVLMIDLDRFSRINACLGSLAGDELLITAARRMRGALRAHDILARTGGDQFAILLNLQDDVAEAEHVAARIRGALATPFRLSDYELRVSCAIGMAFGGAGSPEEHAEDVVRHAQFAMKRAKASGRAEAYQTRAFDVVRDQFAMETALRRAIEGNRLTLAYQAICDLDTGSVVAFEALARWTDEAGIQHSPDAFIPVAEESGLIVPLGRWAIDEALRTLATWDRRHGAECGVSVAVNLSAIQLQRDSIAPMVQAALQRHGLAGRRLKLELTESAVIADPERTARVLHALKALGATIAMDDFGTGYSNLASLQSLPIDILKIDRGFVTGMLADPDKVAITRAVLSLAKTLGMATVAEGVETHDLGRSLAALGCTYGQGYAFSRPLDADAAYALLRERNP